MTTVSICIPTYNRERELVRLWQQTLFPIRERFGANIDIIVRDNSAGVTGYNSRAIQEIFDGEDYVLNEANINYHGNIARLFESCKLGSYVWFWPDDDIYCLESISCIIELILSGEITADIVLPPFSYLNRKGFKSTDNLSKSLSLPKSHGSGYYDINLTTFGEIIKSSSYPFIPLTSSFLFKKNGASSSNNIIKKYSNNAWLHEVVLLSESCASSSVQILSGPPYVLYNEIRHPDGTPVKCGMSIEYFHKNNIELCQLRANIFRDKSLFNLSACWRESILWLIQQKDGSISWSNGSLYSFRLALRALHIAIKYLDLRLLFLSISYLITPAYLITAIRKARGSHRSLQR